MTDEERIPLVLAVARRAAARAQQSTDAIRVAATTIRRPGDALDGFAKAHDERRTQEEVDRAWQAGREAGFRDALIALAEHRGAFIDELDRNIADALRRDREYLRAHDAAVLRDATDALREAFSGDEFEENAQAAAGEGEWSWFKWLAVSTMERAVGGVA